MKAQGTYLPLKPLADTGQIKEKAACYHCEIKERTNTFCEMWRVWTCLSCLSSEHRKHHVACEREASKNPTSARQETKYFRLPLTLYDGRRLSLLCKLGEKLQMEDHWMGTYVFAASSAILVRETREQINELLLIGLRSCS